METFSTKIHFTNGTTDCSAVLPAVWRFSSEKRGYEMTIHLDLFGGFWLDRRWWGLMNNRGSKKRDQFLSLPAALDFCDDLVRRRLRHGYLVQSLPNITWDQGDLAGKKAAKKERRLHVTASMLRKMPKKDAPRVVSREPNEIEERQLTLL